MIERSCWAPAAVAKRHGGTRSSVAGSRSCAPAGEAAGVDAAVSACGTQERQPAPGRRLCGRSCPVDQGCVGILGSCLAPPHSSPPLFFHSWLSSSCACYGPLGGRSSLGVSAVFLRGLWVSAFRVGPRQPFWGGGSLLRLINRPAAILGERFLGLLLGRFCPVAGSHFWKVAWGAAVCWWPF